MEKALDQWEVQESSSLDQEWSSLRQVVYDIAKTAIGKPNRKHWFDPADLRTETSDAEKKSGPPKSVTD